MERQFTSTVYIVRDNKVLLIFHKKLQKWLPPGGHLDPNELPSEGALREVFEETGLKVELIPQENIWIERWNAKSFPRPYMCLLEEIPATPSQAAHQHIDFIYIGRPVEGTEMENPDETDGMRWFSLEEVLGLPADKEIFLETQETLTHILNQQSLALS